MSEPTTPAATNPPAPTMPPQPTTPTVPLDEIQAGIFDPTAIAHEVHLFFEFGDANTGRDFLRAVMGSISTESDVAAGLAALQQVRVNIGFTWLGLAALGVEPDVLASFPEEFRDGMAARAAILGDTRDNAPSEWDPLFAPGELGNRIHAWVMVQAPTPAARDGMSKKFRGLATANGLTLLGKEAGAQLPEERQPAKEHFGFNDNLSQPGVYGVGQPVYPGQGSLQGDEWRPVPVGCFLLGYENGFGETPSRPTDEALRMNSSFMVFRKLAQDVAGFRSYVKETAALLDMDAELCAAKFVGRWRSGAPLELSPDADDPTILDDPDTANAFAYRRPTCPVEPGTNDLEGVRVPRGAHIRRVNPRDALHPNAVVDTINHRIIRRSAPYGPYLDESAEADDGTPRGLLFRAFNASILDQFELIQGEWVNSSNEGNGLSTDRDPFVGTAEPYQAPKLPGDVDGDTDHEVVAARRLRTSFTIPRADGSCPTRHGLPRFVTVKGGTYLFVPSLSALARLATDPPPPASPGPQVPLGANFAAIYDSIVVAPSNPPAKVLQEQIGLVLGYQDHLVKLGNDLRATPQTAIFPTSIGVLLSTAADIQEVFTRDDVFSVGGYGQRLINVTGPFLLGMDKGPQYDQETAIMRFVAPSSDLPTIGQWLTTRSAQAVSAALPSGSGTFDLVPTVANKVPLAFVGHYFGVAGPNDAIFMTWLHAIAIYVFEWWSTLFPGITTYTTTIAPQISQYIDDVIAGRSAAIAAGDPSVPDDVLTRLLGLPGVDDPSHPMALDRLGIRRNLAGFALGSSVALSSAIVSAVQYLLDPANAAALATTTAAARAGDAALVQQCMLEAARLGAPSPPSVFRIATTDVTIAAGTPRAKTIPAGTVVALNPAIAMTDPAFVPDPMTFKTDRPNETYIMFGDGMHSCFGTAIGMMTLGCVGMALFANHDLSEVSPMTKGASFPDSGFPASYIIKATKVV